MDSKDTMGHDENITDETFEKAARAQGQTVEEAMQNTYDLLKQKLGK